MYVLLVLTVSKSVKHSKQTDDRKTNETCNKPNHLNLCVAEAKVKSKSRTGIRSLVYQSVSNQAVEVLRDFCGGAESLTSFRHAITSWLSFV